MGIPCSKNFPSEKLDTNTDQYWSFQSHKLSPTRYSHSNELSTQGSAGRSWSDEEHPQQEESVVDNVNHNTANTWNSEEIYDGIPRIPASFSQKSRSIRSTQAAVAKVSEVSSRLGKAGTMGLEKAVHVLDVLGSSVTDLNSRSGFAYAVAPRGTEISILAFEVANTIVKCSSLMHSLSEERIRHVQEVVLLSEGAQLISKDTDQLMRIVLADKREELNILSREVVRFGNLCKDPQWHHLDRYFLTESVHEKQFIQDAELEMKQLMTLVQHTTELYHELHALHRLEKEYKSKHRDESNSTHSQRGENAPNLRAELRKQQKMVRKLKKISLWSRSLEEVMEKLVDIVLCIHLMINNSFSNDGPDVDESQEDAMLDNHRLGPDGLALHYANIILQIDGMVTRSVSTTPSARDSLYQNLPPSIKSSLRSRVHSFHVEELTGPEIKIEMEKTLQWLVPLASNTVRAHHGFGWVGEWANAGSEASKTSAGQSELLRIETLYHADKEKTESYILDQLVWLHYLVTRSKTSVVGSSQKAATEGPTWSPLQKTHYPMENSSKTKSLTDLLTMEDQEMLHDVSKRKRSPGISRSEDFDTIREPITKHERLSKSSSHPPTRHEKDLLFVDGPLSSRLCSTDPGSPLTSSHDIDLVQVVV